MDPQVEFEHMFSLYYWAYFVSDDDVISRTKEAVTEDEIACFYPSINVLGGRLQGQPEMAAAPLTISESSLVIAAWRVLL